MITIYHSNTDCIDVTHVNCMTYFELYSSICVRFVAFLFNVAVDFSLIFVCIKSSTSTASL